MIKTLLRKIMIRDKVRENYSVSVVMADRYCRQARRRVPFVDEDFMKFKKLEHSYVSRALSNHTRLQYMNTWLWLLFGKKL